MYMLFLALIALAVGTGAGGGKVSVTNYAAQQMMQQFELGLQPIVMRVSGCTRFVANAGSIDIHLAGLGPGLHAAADSKDFIHSNTYDNIIRAGYDRSPL